MAINYSFTPSELINTKSANMQTFNVTLYDYQNEEDITTTTNELVTDTTVYNSFCNTIGSNLEIVNNLNIKNWDIKITGEYNFFNLNYPTIGNTYQIKTDLIIPICIYNNLQNYYITIQKAYNNSQQYIGILYPESRTLYGYAYCNNGSGDGFQLYNINENVFILVDDLKYVGNDSNRQNIIFYEDYCLGDRPGEGQYNVHAYNSPTTVLSQYFPLIKISTNTAKIAIYPLTSLENSNKHFEGIYGSTLTNYNNEQIRADGITYLVLGRRNDITMGYTISSEILGRE